jgi:hypothetical protein
MNPMLCVEDTFPGSSRYSVEEIANTGYVVIAYFWRLDLMMVRSFRLLIMMWGCCIIFFVDVYSGGPFLLSAIV